MNETRRNDFPTRFSSLFLIVRSSFFSLCIPESMGKSVTGVWGWDGMGREWHVGKRVLEPGRNEQRAGSLGGTPPFFKEHLR